MNRKISLGAAVTFCVIVAAVTFSITWLVSSGTFDQMLESFSQNDKLGQKMDEIDQYVRANYLGELNETQLEDGMAKGYTSGLGDPYAGYYTAEEMRNVGQDSQGIVNGIGVDCTADESGYILVMSVIEGSPAAAAGIQSNDLIVSVEGRDVKQMGYQQGVSLLNGDPGTTVFLTYRHEGEEHPVQIVRQKIIPLWVTYRMDGEVGYIQIKDFNDSAVQQFQDALQNVRGQNAKSLVFDVRRNSGGTLDSVCKILDPLLPEGTIVTETKKTGETVTLSSSDANQVELPMTVLTDGSTASAAELFVAALRDYEKAQQVGQKTYGKGVMQETHTLRDGSAVKITVGYFNPPKSGNFNGKGLEPDYEVILSDQATALLSRSMLALEQDDQYKKAVEVLRSAQ